MLHKRHSGSPSASESDTSSDSSISSMEHLQPHPKKSSKKRGRKSDKGDLRSKISKENNSELEVQEEYLAAARAMARCTDLFCNVEKLLRVGLLLQQEQATENGELEESEAERESRQKRLASLSTNTLDWYKQQLSASKELTQIARKMTAVISGTRSDDATRLKVQIGHYVAPEPLKEDPALARKWMEIGCIRMTSIDFLVFLWARNPPGSRYDKDAMHEGLFQGYLIERIMCHIFTGPSTALGDDSRATCSCNASLHDMTTVEAEHIAYACVQARFAISNKNKWSEADGEFNNRAFYYNIIDFIRECEDRDWAEGLLKWWNRALFKNENGREGGTTITDDNGPGNAAGSSSAPINSLAKMRAQMAARASTAKQPAAPELTPTIPTPPQSSVTPEPELPPLPIASVTPQPELPPPPIVRSPRLMQMAPIPPKSPALSELTPDDVPSDNNEDLEDVSTNKKRKKKAPKTSRGKTKHRVIEESDDEDQELAKPTKGRTKRAARRK
ncbi:uncharacterized protein F5147DRAFT_820813 [Suillus discolor]|uniref:Uncharacterized protein n=1 Tax=Suillus discolor TaxID=1912936 RepID=A0A9P7EX29_9AGAM|nr:uncharacterized protein F5147DRAFT_820813 [Suillus discolor]KAG2093896.1 hypothetical protein F5147DRAFT_820813 [Suillus discolor]